MTQMKYFNCAGSSDRRDSNRHTRMSIRSTLTDLAESPSSKIEVSLTGQAAWDALETGTVISDLQLFPSQI